MGSPAIALIGCGAVSETFHIPALAKRPDLVKSLILVDPDIERARRIRAQLGAADAVADHKSVISRVQGAIVATPHRSHHPVTLDFVRAGVHVLCEKPLADTATEVDEIVRAAEEHRVHVAVNQTRRFFSSFAAIQRSIAAGEIGELREIDDVLGEPVAWPAATESYFGKKAGGRGVLFDTGAHIIDLVCWWMGGQPEVVDCRDDARGGTEAVSIVDLRLGDAVARVHLSWLTKLRNTYRITGTRGSIEGGVYEWSSYTQRDANGRARKVRTDKPSRALSDFMDMLLANFVDAIGGRAKPRVSAADVRPVIAVIDECYDKRRELDQPWLDASERLIARV